MADVGEVLDAIRNQSRINQEVTRNQGEQTRAAVDAAAHATIVGLRRTIWRAAGKTKKEIDDLEAQSSAEFDELLAALTPEPDPGGG